MSPVRSPLFFLAAGFLAGAPVDGGELSTGVLKQVRSAVVEVHIEGQLRGGGAFLREPNGKVFVITAAHLFPDPGMTGFVRTHDGEAYFASLSAYDLGYDLALLEVDPAVRKYGALRVAATTPKETAPLFNFGPALGRRTLILPGSMADARVSYTDFSRNNGYLAHVFVSGINPVLTSGGIWVNEEGDVVGVQHGRLIGDEGAPSSGLSMISVPSAISRLLKEKSVSRTPGLGGYVWETWMADAALLDELPRGVEGLVVKTLFPGRPLAIAGVKQFDVILRCDGKRLRRRHELINQIRSREPGSVFTLEVLTPGSEMRRDVQLRTDTLEDYWK